MIGEYVFSQQEQNTLDRIDKGIYNDPEFHRVIAWKEYNERILRMGLFKPDEGVVVRGNLKVGDLIRGKVTILPAGHVKSMPDDSVAIRGFGTFRGDSRYAVVNVEYLTQSRWVVGVNLVHFSDILTVNGEEYVQS